MSTKSSFLQSNLLHFLIQGEKKAAIYNSFWLLRHWRINCYHYAWSKVWFMCSNFDKMFPLDRCKMSNDELRPIHTAVIDNFLFLLLPFACWWQCPNGSEEWGPRGCKMTMYLLSETHPQIVRGEKKVVVLLYHCFQPESFVFVYVTWLSGFWQQIRHRGESLVSQLQRVMKVFSAAAWLWSTTRIGEYFSKTVFISLEFL